MDSCVHGDTLLEGACPPVGVQDRDPATGGRLRRRSRLIRLRRLRSRGRVARVQLVAAVHSAQPILFVDHLRAQQALRSTSRLSNVCHACVVPAPGWGCRPDAQPRAAAHLLLKGAQKLGQLLVGALLDVHAHTWP